MAIVFELVVNFGTNEPGAQAATERVGESATLTCAGCRFVRGMGYGAQGPRPDIDARSLTSEGITQVGHALYGLLGSFAGYRAAIVGWDPGSLVDVGDLEAD